MVTFTPGKFEKLEATITFHFGPLSQDITEGSPVEFDGRTVKYDGVEKVCPQLKLAVQKGWLSKVGVSFQEYHPEPAGVEVHEASATGEKRDRITMGAVSEEEAVVGTVKGTNEKRASSSAQPTAPQPTTPQPTAPQPTAADPGVNVDTTGMNSVEAANATNAARLKAALDQPIVKGYHGGQRHGNLGDDVEATKLGGKFKMVVSDGQQGTVVGKVKASERAAAVGMDGEASRKAGTKTADVTKVTSAAVDNSTVEQGGIIMGLKAKTASTGEAIQNTKARVSTESPAISIDPVEVASPQTHISAEGNEDIASIHEGGAVGDVAEARSGDDLADLLPDAAMAAPPKRPKPQQANPEDEIQEILAEWDKKRHWKKRVKEAVEMYGDWPEFLEALFEIEVPSVIKHIKDQLASQ